MATTTSQPTTTPANERHAFFVKEAEKYEATPGMGKLANRYWVYAAVAEMTNEQLNAAADMARRAPETTGPVTRRAIRAEVAWRVAEQPVKPTPENRGMLPSGTYVAGMGAIVRQSDTAYVIANSEGDEFWVSFDRVHGRPAPATPLVGF